jgi:type I site-specific restriction-modification system R (restriction) subunit
MEAHERRDLLEDFLAQKRLLTILSTFIFVNFSSVELNSFVFFDKFHSMVF